MPLRNGLALALFIAAAKSSPQIAHAGAGEPITAAATVQVAAPAVKTTTFNNGLYTPQSVTRAGKSAEVAVTSTTRVVTPVVLLTTSSTTLSTSSSVNDDAILAQPTTSSSSVSSSSSSTTSSSQSSSSSASASAANDAASASASGIGSGSTPSVAIPLAIIGAVIALALAAGIAWSRRRQLRAWWSGHEDEQRDQDWNEKHGMYRDGDFDPYSGRQGANWPMGDPDTYSYDDGDRYGAVSSRMRNHSSMGAYPAVEETGNERGWLWGSRRVSDRPAYHDDELLANQNQYDAMLAQSRTGYLPSEAAAQLNRQPSYLARAGQAIASSFNGNRRSRRIARLSGESGPRPGTWDEHGSWRPLEGEDRMEEKSRSFPVTPPSKINISAFSGIDSVRKPLVAATPESSVSRSVRRWQLADDPQPSGSPSASPTRANHAVPSVLRSGQMVPGSPASPRVAPDLYYASSPSPVKRSPLPPQIPHGYPQHRPVSQVPTLVFPSSPGGPPVPQKGPSADAFGPYTVMPPRRGGSPAKPYRNGGEGELRPASRTSQRSGSLTDLVTRLLDEDEI